jgi:hypothetical protein
MREFISLMFQFIFIVSSSITWLVVMYYVASGNLFDAGLFSLMTICLLVLSYTASPDL